VEEKGLPSVRYRKKEIFWNHIENTEVLTERLRWWKSEYLCLLYVLEGWSLWRKIIQFNSVLRTSRFIKWHIKTLPKVKIFTKKPLMNGNVDFKVSWGLENIHTLERSKDGRNAVVYRLKAYDNFCPVSLIILSQFLNFVLSSWVGCTSEPISQLSVCTTL
jgi:hypothetical protein